MSRRDDLIAKTELWRRYLRLETDHLLVSKTCTDRTVSMVTGQRQGLPLCVSSRI
jgi:hypothetical protein